MGGRATYAFCGRSDEVRDLFGQEDLELAAVSNHARSDSLPVALANLGASTQSDRNVKSQVSARYRRIPLEGCARKERETHEVGRADANAREELSPVGREQERTV